MLLTVCCLNPTFPNLNFCFRVICSKLNVQCSGFSMRHRVSTRYCSIAVFGDYFLRYCGIWQFFLRYCGVQNTLMSPSFHCDLLRFQRDREAACWHYRTKGQVPHSWMKKKIPSKQLRQLWKGAVNKYASLKDISPNKVKDAQIYLDCFLSLPWTQKVSHVRGQVIKLWRPGLRGLYVSRSPTVRIVCWKTELAK